MSNPYERPFERLGGIQDPISGSVRFGRSVRIGHHVVIDPDCRLGDEVFIGHNSMIREKVRIGNRSIIGHLVVIEAETLIGDDVTIQSQCHITKMARIEDRVFMGPKAMLINTNKISHGRNYKAKLEGPHIKFGARIGSGAIIMPGVTIGRNAVIGAGAIVVKDVPDEQIWFGKQMMTVSQVASFQNWVPKDEILGR
jgi:acetyltransferase-like isoleucine patch superfamily enzyme